MHGHKKEKSLHLSVFEVQIVMDWIALLQFCHVCFCRVIEDFDVFCTLLNHSTVYALHFKSVTTAVCCRTTLVFCVIHHSCVDLVKKKDQILFGLIGTSSGNCQEMETCMVRVCHMPHLLQNHPSGHFGGQATLW